MPPGIEGLDIYIGVALTLFILDRTTFIWKSKKNGNGNGLRAHVMRLADTVERLERVVEGLSTKTTENSVKVEFLMREREKAV